MPPAHPLEAVTHPAPYPYYAALARDRPLYRDTALGLWVAAHPDAIGAVMRHPAARVRPVAEPVPRGLGPGPAADMFGRFVRMNDSARHDGLKALLADFIRAQALAPPPQAWRQPAPQDAAALDRYLAAAPVHAQAAFLGLPPAVHAECAMDIGAFLAALPADAAADRIAAGHAAAARLQGRLASHLAGPDASPALRALSAQAARSGIEPDLLAANLAGLLFQSCEAGAGLLGNALVMAGRRRTPATLTLEEAGTLIDDVVRLDPPLHNTRRFMAHTADIGGQRIEAGEPILLVLAAAAMIQPDAGWTFGAHRHACPGGLPARRHAADALVHLLRAGVDPVALAARFRYRPLPNARLPRFDLPKEDN
ncbi:cytochrome [Achromobacter spanius]|uniref:cytochrome n=1 Tax=Achromobacter spanius TaxID=217203 RepID=UPI00320A03D4